MNAEMSYSTLSSFRPAPLDAKAAHGFCLSLKPQRFQNAQRERFGRELRGSVLRNDDLARGGARHQSRSSVHRVTNDRIVDALRRPDIPGCDNSRIDTDADANFGPLPGSRIAVQFRYKPLNRLCSPY